MSVSSGVLRTAGNRYAFAHRLRHLVLFLLETKRAGHSAAARIDRLQFDAHLRSSDSSSPISSALCDGSGRAAALFAESCGGSKPGAWRSRNSLRRNVWLRNCVARASRGNRLRSSSRNTEAQLGSSTTIGMPASICAPRTCHDSFADIPWPCRACRNRRAAGRSTDDLRNGDVEIRALQHLERGAAGFRMEIIVERVRPQDHFGLHEPLELSSASEITPPHAGYSRCAPNFWKVEGASCGIFRCGARCKTLCRIWRNPGALLKKFASRGACDPSSAQRSIMPNAYACSGRLLLFVIVRQKFRFVGGDVHVRRALRFARLAGKAQIERFLDAARPSSRRAPLRPAALQTACARGRACCALPRASPCSWGTSRRCRACGTRRGRCSAAWPWQTNRHRPEIENEFCGSSGL